MDVFSTVIGLLLAGIALFVGYRVGVKDGFRGGVHTGRMVERSRAAEERRFLAARAANSQPQIDGPFLPNRLPAPYATAHDALSRHWGEEDRSEAFEQVGDAHAHAEGDYLERAQGH